MMMVLITGACGGLGRAMASECARRGFELFLTDIYEPGLVSIRQGLERQYGATVYTHVCDITDAGQTADMFERINNMEKRPNMLLNIAGIDHEGSFMAQSGERIADIVRLNIEATLRVTHAALAVRKKAEKFYIVNVSSLASLYPIPLKATYAASKRFLLDFSIALGQELKYENVRVLALCPGGLPTTQEALHGIAAQGIWGSLTTNGLGLVAQRTISRVMAGRRLYIPGLVNRTLSILGALAPPAMVARLLYKRWRQAQSQWLTGSL
jgi:short-subunit dehydrogenase